MKKFRLKRGDQVIAIAGRSKGKSGEIIKVNVDKSTLLVKGMNLLHHFERASASSKGGVVQRESPIHISNVALLDPKTKTPTKVGFVWDKNSEKKRIAKKSGEIIV
ncbi:MAG: 50S ribosomal protein L24 [Alphaproteobacteria bacterium]|nr:MAG: 50S ribosomal protein L24 [Alphaproteobacteria bacterium]